MNRPRIAVRGNFIGAVNKFVNPLSIGNSGAIFGQGGSDSHIVNFFKTARTLAFQGTGTGHEDHW